MQIKKIKNDGQILYYCGNRNISKEQYDDIKNNYIVAGSESKGQTDPIWYNFILTKQVKLNNSFIHQMNICLNKGTIYYLPHITIYRGRSLNPTDIWKIKKNLKGINKSVEGQLSTVKQNSTNYCILGNGKDAMEFDINSLHFSNLESIKSEANTHFQLPKNGKCFLAISLGNTDMTDVYNLIKENSTNDSINDISFYTEEKMKEFKIHITLATFQNIDDAVDSLYMIKGLNVAPVYADDGAGAGAKSMFLETITIGVGSSGFMCGQCSNLADKSPRFKGNLKKFICNKCLYTRTP